MSADSVIKVVEQAREPASIQDLVSEAASLLQIEVPEPDLASIQAEEDGSPPPLPMPFDDDDQDEKPEAGDTDQQKGAVETGETELAQKPSGRYSSLASRKT